LGRNEDARFKMQDARCKIQDARCKMQDARWKMEDREEWMTFKICILICVFSEIRGEKINHNS